MNAPLPAGVLPPQATDLRLQVRAVRLEALGVHSFELCDPEGALLPEVAAGAHVDVHLPGGLARSYSLAGDPADRTRWLLGVLREAQSGGGSRAMHESVRVGDVLRVGAPRNAFAMVDGAAHTVLLAGGIGITPLKAMVHSLVRQGRSFELHYCARSERHAAFVEELRALVSTSAGLAPYAGTVCKSLILRVRHGRYWLPLLRSGRGRGVRVDVQQRALGRARWHCDTPPLQGASRLASRDRSAGSPQAARNPGFAPPPSPRFAGRGSQHHGALRQHPGSGAQAGCVPAAHVSPRKRGEGATQGSLHLHCDGGDPAKGLDIAALLATPAPGTHLYYCGPAGFMKACADASAHWPAGTVHFEHFKPPGTKKPALAEGAFELRLARAGLTLQVQPEQTIVRAIELAGLRVPTSCLSGLCGSCKVNYLEGEVEHRDYILNDEQQRRCLTVCVSRARGGHLVLDL